MSHAKRRPGARGVRWAAMYRDPLGIWRSAGNFDTKQIAEREATRAQLRVSDGEWLPPESESPWISDWLDMQLLRLERGVEDTTFAAYESAIETHIRPVLGNLRLQALTAEGVSRFLTVLETGREDKVDPDAPRRRGRTQKWTKGKSQPSRRVHQPLSPKSIRNVHALLRRMLAHAVETGLLRSNPAAGVPLPVVPRTPKRSITYATFLDVLDQIPARWAVLVELAAESGARWGELLAFTAASLEGDLWKIDKTITETTKAASGSTSPFKVKGYTKNREIRDVLLDRPMADKLRALVAERGLGPHDFVFITEDGNHPSRATFRQDVWIPAVRRADIGRTLRLHDLRGTHASWLLAGKQDIHAVKKRLGWERLETANAYLGSLPDAQEDSLTALRAAKQRYGRAS